MHPCCNPSTTVQLLLADKLSNKQVLCNPECLWPVSKRMIDVQLTSCSRFTAGHVICKGSSSSSCAYLRSLTFMCRAWFLSSEYAGHSSVHELRSAFSKYMPFCKTTTIINHNFLLSVYETNYTLQRSLTVSAHTHTHTHTHIFILVINQLDAQNLFYNKFISCLYMFRAPCAHRQEIKNYIIQHLVSSHL